METKRWNLIFSGLCLALVFSVSSVEAQRQCDPCHRCDQDGDGFIGASSFCLRKCGVSDDENDLNRLIPNKNNTFMCTVDDPEPDSPKFRVTVFFGDFTFENHDGSADNVVGKVSGNRQSLQEGPMTMLDLSGLTPPTGCNFIFGGMSGIFDLSTARIPPRSDNLTFVTATFRDFDVR